MKILQMICKHPAKSLTVEKDETVKHISNLFDEVTYHLSCSKCGKLIDIKYSKTLKDFHDYKKEEVLL